MTCMFPLWGNSTCTESNDPLTRLCMYCSAEKPHIEFHFKLDVLYIDIQHNHAVQQK